METRQVDKLTWREDLYPRIKPDPVTIQRYAGNLEVLPPVEINQRNEIIDGYHRWTAHRKVEAETITVTVTETASDFEMRALAIKRNSTHGLQLDNASKKREAIWLYGAGTGLDKKAIADTLSVSLRTVSNYLENVDKQLRAERKQKIQDMWLACYTINEIAPAVNLGKSQVSELCPISETLPKSDKVLSEFMDDDFIIPLYNVWTFAKKSNKLDYFGNSEPRILENLLYLYTEPFDIVVDPFAGSGSTVEVCKKRLRRYWISDRKPIVEREAEIRELDITQGLPPLHNRWSDVALTYLDPPYWWQAKGKYSDDPEDFGNMELVDFYLSLAKVVGSIAARQSKGAIALLMQPTQWNAPGRAFVDHIMHLINDLLDKKKMVLDNRVSVPYSTEQYNPQQVEWAKENKKLLVLTRELIIWSIVND